MKSTVIYPEASVHGRFQPPHKGHLEYLIAAKRICRFLWVGISQFNIRQLHPCGPGGVRHRGEQSANVLTYSERVRIITEMLSEEGIPRDQFSCTPFPIDEIDLLPDFLEPTVPCLTTVYDQWNLKKIEILERAGYKVIILYERTKKEIQGSVVRNSILAGDCRWRDMVPSATVRAVERLGLQGRLSRLYSSKLQSG